MEKCCVFFEHLDELQLQRVNLKWLSSLVIAKSNTTMKNSILNLHSASVSTSSSDS
jgi:hypothetical protein